ncbi:unnamed protein product [Closterium sp. Yama58-4]|nr:unnamed protein product [Closterium sp. Yama58-4]
MSMTSSSPHVMDMATIDDAAADDAYATVDVWSDGLLSESDGRDQSSLGRTIGLPPDTDDGRGDCDTHCLLFGRSCSRYRRRFWFFSALSPALPGDDDRIASGSGCQFPPHCNPWHGEDARGRREIPPHGVDRKRARRRLEEAGGKMDEEAEEAGEEGEERGRGGNGEESDGRETRVKRWMRGPVGLYVSVMSPHSSLPNDSLPHLTRASPPLLPSSTDVAASSDNTPGNSPGNSPANSPANTPDNPPKRNTDSPDSTTTASNASSSSLPTLPLLSASSLYFGLTPSVATTATTTLSAFLSPVNPYDGLPITSPPPAPTALPPLLVPHSLRASVPPSPFPFWLLAPNASPSLLVASLLPLEASVENQGASAQPWAVLSALLPFRHLSLLLSSLSLPPGGALLLLSQRPRPSASMASLHSLLSVRSSSLSFLPGRDGAGQAVGERRGKRGERCACGRAGAEQKSQFMVNMSHELRTPMAGIIGLMDILQCDDNLTADQLDIVAQIHRCAMALLGILNNILDLSKVEAGKLELAEERFNPARELEGLVDLFAVQCASSGLDIALDLDDDLSTEVIGDAPRFRQIFANLLSNAIKFTPQGWITIRGYTQQLGAYRSAADLIPTPRAYTQPEAPPGFGFDAVGGGGGVWRKGGESKVPSCRSMGAVSERNGGKGIHPSMWTRVFESFVQEDESTTRAHGGSGIGLSIVKGFVERMGGFIAVVPKDTPGTRFAFHLCFQHTNDGGDRVESVAAWSAAAAAGVAGVAGNSGGEDELGQNWQQREQQEGAEQEEGLDEDTEERLLVLLEIEKLPGMAQTPPDVAKVRAFLTKLRSYQPSGVVFAWVLTPAAAPSLRSTLRGFSVVKPLHPGKLQRVLGLMVRGSPSEGDAEAGMGVAGGAGDGGALGSGSGACGEARGGVGGAAADTQHGEHCH